MAAEHCPHCGCLLPAVSDTFCGKCRTALDEPPTTVEHRTPAPPPQVAEVRRREFVDVRVHGKAQILLNLAVYLPFTLWLGLVYFALATAGLMALLEGPLGKDQARSVGIPVVVAIVLIHGVLYIWFVVNRLSQSRLSLENDLVVIRGQTSRGLVERRYPVSDIEAITIGEQLNVVEKVIDYLHRLRIPKTGIIGVVKNLKAGRLLIMDRSGGKELFHSIDKVFDLDSLSEFATELSHRGVIVVASPP